mgnify:CR=1 FL=1
MIRAFDAELGINNSVAGSMVSGNLSTSAMAEERIQALGENGLPDLILVSAGCNDWGFCVLPEEFESAYQTMLCRLKNTYPYAQIWCCTLPEGKEPEGEEAVEKMEMKRESDFVRYLFKWLLLIFTVFAVVSICFNLVTYMREKQYYSRIIEQEQQERINYLSRNINEELTNLKITANMAVKEEIVQDLYCRYDYVNSYERSKLMEAIRKRCMEIDNLNSFVSSSWLYLPEKNLKIGRDGYDFVEEEAYAFVLENKENELISIKDGKAYINRDS